MAAPATLRREDGPVTSSIIEFARLFWQVVRETPGFYLNRLDQLTKRLHAIETLEAIVGKKEARVWLYLLGGDVEAAINLVQSGYTIEQIMEIQEGMRS